MSTTEETGALAKALAEVQRAMPVVAKSKTARIPGKNGGAGYSYSYADLGDVTAAVMPLLVANGLAFTCLPRQGERGYELAAVLLHTSGERVEGALPLHGNDPQSLGGSITYMRRYLLGCLTGVVTDEDPDGAPAQGSSPARAWDGPTTPQILNRIDQDAGRVGVDYSTATAKWRKDHGDLSVDDLDGLEPWVLMPLAEAITKRANEVEAERRAAEQDSAAEASARADQNG